MTEFDEMTQEQYAAAAGYWKKKDAQGAAMPEDELREFILKFIQGHNTLALACASDEGIRVTPLEYSWKEDSLIVISEGGEKFRHLAKNHTVSACIYEPYTGFGKLNSLQVQGHVQVAELNARTAGKYDALLSYPADVFERLDHPMYLIRIVPERFDLLSSGLKEKGYAVRQHLYVAG